MEDYEVVKSDFNEIAGLEAQPGWNHNNCYFKYLLRFLPKRAGQCLDIGCGQGELSALLAQRADSVIAVDLADKMIESAKKLHNAPNIKYICGNILDIPFADDSLDVIISTATAHHLPYEWLLEFAKKKLKKGGKFLILDLVKEETILEKLLWGFAVVPNYFMNWIKNGHSFHPNAHSEEAWKRHGMHDTYMKISEVKKAAGERLPGASVRRKLFWRYVLIWEKQ